MGTVLHMCDDIALGPSLLFPKYYLIFYSECPELLPYYSLRVDQLFLKILSLIKPKNDEIQQSKHFSPISSLHTLQKSVLLDTDNFLQPAVD